MMCWWVTMAVTHAVMSAVGGDGAVRADRVAIRHDTRISQSDRVVRVSMPPTLNERPGRISMPSELLVGLSAPVVADVQPRADGTIDVPANARGRTEVAIIQDQPEAWATDDNVVDTNVVYGAHGVRPYGYAGYGARKPLRRLHGVAGWAGGRSAEEVQRPQGPFETQPSSIFDDTADDAYRRAQLRFHEASYPRLNTFEDANRRAQLEFHRSTLTPGRRESDGLRHERNSLRGPELRRDNSGTRGRRW